MYALGLYSLAPIRDAVTQVFTDANFSNKCHGHQGLRDDVNCGRFVLGYIEQKVANANQVLTDPSSKFNEIQQKINNPEQGEVQPQIANGGNGEAADQAQPGYSAYVRNSRNSQVVSIQQGF